MSTSLRKPRGSRRAITVLAVLAIVCAALAAPFTASSSTRYLGSMSGASLNRPVVGMAATRTGHGYWLVASDGGVFTFGDAHFYGSAGHLRLNQPIVGITRTRSGHGYWLVASDGGVFTFGDAHFYGSTGHRRLHRPIVGMAATRTGHGYWLVASDGGVFTFGDAHFYGSTGHNRVHQPIVGMAGTRTGHGYWLAASDGRVFSFGDAHFYGSARGQAMPAPAVGIARTPSGKGYWLVTADGTTYAYGNAHAWGTDFPPTAPLADSVVTIAASSKGGYWVASRGGTVGTSGKRMRSPQLVAQALLVRMNAERAARHLPPLAWNSLLAARASTWARTLLATGQFRHQDLSQIVAASGYRFEEVGENLFSGTGGAANAGTAHVALMGSVSHRENILLPQGQLVGIGAVCRGSKLVVVEDFAIKAGAPMPPPGQGIPPAQPIVAPSSGGASC